MSCNNLITAAIATECGLPGIGLSSKMHRHLVAFEVGDTVCREHHEALGT